MSAPVSFNARKINTINTDVNTLLARLTAARAGYLDNINQAGLLQLTAARAGYLNNINNTQLLNIPNLSTLTAARIGYLDNINSATNIANFGWVTNDVKEADVTLKSGDGWVQLIASTATDIYILGVSANGDAGGNLTVLIGTGGAGSESTKMTFLGKVNAVQAFNYWNVFPMRKIASGTRIAVDTGQDVSENTRVTIYYYSTPLSQA